MTKNNLILFFIISLGFPQELELSVIECQLQTERSALYGHNGCYSQNLTEYLMSPDEDELGGAFMNGWNFVPDETTLRFLTSDMRPFVFVRREADGSSFVVWGPLYSILKEASWRLNQRWV